MADHEIGSREEWQEARDELAKLETQHAELNEEIKKQRLALPCRSLRLVVPAHRVERPRQRAARAARTERRVDAERDPLGGRVGERANQGRARALGRLLPFGPLSLVDEHDVDVRRVIELGPAQLPKRDNRPRRAGLIEGGRRVPARNLRDAVIGQ